jgi:hypothetical protein
MLVRSNSLLGIPSDKELKHQQALGGHGKLFENFTFVEEHVLGEEGLNQRGWPISPLRKGGVEEMW